MVAINTDYMQTYPSTSHTKGMLKQIADAGFTHVHWVHEWKGTYQYSYSEMLQIRSWLEEYGLKAKGVHASDGTINFQFDDRKMIISPVEENRVAGVELVKNRIDLAKVIDAGEIVLHLKLFHKMNLGSEYKIFQKSYWTQLFKSFDEIIAYAEKKNIKVAIENLEHPRTELQMEQFDRLFNRYNNGTLGFCFDLGHNMITDKNMFSFLERYNNYLISLHLNCGDFNKSNTENYKEVLELDNHYIPNRNMVDIEYLAKLIAKSPYELPVTFEISAHGDIESELKKTLNIGLELNELILGDRHLPNFVEKTEVLDK